MSLTSLYEANLRYTRNDITTTETCQKGCLRVMPQGKKSRSKIVVGDKTGVASVFQVGKHHDVKLDFKTAPETKGIGAIELFSDQVFVAAGSRVSAYTKKGRPFFGLETNMSESIQTLRVDTPYLFIGGDYVLTRFQESTELGYYMAPDRIHATLLRKTENPADFDVFCACQDRMIRTLRNGTEKPPGQTGETAVDSPVHALAYLARTDKPEITELVYGTLSGSIGGFGIGSKNELIRRYTMLPDRRVGAIVTLAACDITKDGFTDIVVGRDDGSIELFSFNKNPDGTPIRLWGDSVAECINTVDTGCITNAVREEIVLHTYTGKVLSFTVCEDDAKTQAIVPAPLQGPQSELSMTQTLSEPPPIAQYDPEVAPKSQILERKELETAQEIARLREMIHIRKAEFAQVSSGNRLTLEQAQAAAEGNMRAVTSNFTVREKLVGEENGVIAVHLETDTPIDSVGIQADVDVELVDQGDHGSHAIILHGKPLKGSASKVAAIARCVDGETTKVVLRFRTVEGQQGTVSCYVIPKVTPRSAQLRTFTIRSLSLHQRVEPEVVEQEAATLSSIKITGGFSAKDIHAWLYQCLPDVPQRISSETNNAVLAFRNGLCGTVLRIRYGKGEVDCASNNISTLSILKEHIAREATARKIAISMTNTFNRESVPTTLRLLLPLLEYQFALVHRHNVLEALREVESQEQSNTFLSADYKDILGHAADIEAEIKRQPKRADYLRFLIMRLMHDVAAFKGESVSQNRAQHLHQLLNERYDSQALLSFFSN